MSLSKDSLSPLLRQLAARNPFKEPELRIRPLEEASFEQDGGFAIWRWGARHSADRPRATYLYNDADGTGLFLTLVGDASGALKEVEIWRGDGQTAVRVPTTMEELSVATRGAVY
jgi:hypothetical protein